MAGLTDWLDLHADRLDQADNLTDNLADDLADALMPALADDGRFRAGVPVALGGTAAGAGDVRDAITSIADVAEHSVTAAFVYWGQRTFIEYLLQSPNGALRERLLPALLGGQCAGATGLSNAMKFLSGMEPLQIRATPSLTGLTSAAGQGWQLDGQLAWVTNLRPAHFIAAAAVAPTDGAAPLVVAFDSAADGVQRSANLELIALRGSHTAAVKLERVAVSPADVISDNAPDWLPRVRPAFLGMQCGMSIGLARASLAQAAAIAIASAGAGAGAGATRGQLHQRVTAARQALEQQADALLAGVADGRFVTRAPELFRLRLALAESVQQALALELQAKGGNAYLEQKQNGFGRRWRESAFIPVITPSLTQLQAALDNHAAAAGAAAAGAGASAAPA